MSRLKGRVTLATVADTAGVSVATVSKVLNGRSDVTRPHGRGYRRSWSGTGTSAAGRTRSSATPSSCSTKALSTRTRSR